MRKITKTSIGILLTVICLIACGSKEIRQAAEKEVPAEGIRAIIQLIESKDFDALVRTRYAEIDKAKDESQIQSLVERLAEAYAVDGNSSRAIANYREALKQAEVAASDDKDMVTYSVSGGTVKLSRMPGGKWGFHL